MLNCQATHQAFERLTPPQPWPDAEVARLFRLRQIEARDWSEIAGLLGRTESGVKSKYKYEIHSRDVRAPSVPFVREPADELALLDRAKRLASQARDLTAAILGDPLPGWSALERQGAGRAGV